MDFEAAKKLVESIISGLGVDAKDVQAKDTADQVAWTVQRGSAAVLIAVIKRESGVNLRVIAPVVTVAEDKKLALYTKLLQLNADGMASSAFGVVGEKVVVVSERPAVDLDASEVDHIIRHVAAVADTFDDRLVGEFGGKRASDK